MPVHFESPHQPEVIALIVELDDYQASLYPPECRYALDLTALTSSAVIFAVARAAQPPHAALGCGAIVLHPAYGELKRMYVQPACRGQGWALALLQALEQAAVQRGCTELKLETGPYQPEALALYARQGFQRCGPFGDYRDDPLSVFMTKTLPALAEPAA